MAVYKYKGIQIDYCSESRGIWLDGDELELLETSEMKAKKPRGKKKGKKWWTIEDTGELILESVRGIWWIVTKK